MKIPIVLVVVAMGALGRAQDKVEADSSTVTVYLPNAVYPGVNLYASERIASSIFNQAGVRIRWRLGQPKSLQRKTPIVLTLSFDTPARVSPDVFAYALVFDGIHIKIFGDRVLEYAHHSARLTTYLLAHVMVHEITHVLEGVDRHSREGVMKARWTPAEIEEMVVKPLSFSPEDIQLIRAGMGRRCPDKATCGASNNPPK